MKSKEQKQKEASARWEAYKALSSEEKIARLDRLGLTAKKERMRILTGKVR